MSVKKKILNYQLIIFIFIFLKIFPPFVNMQNVEHNKSISLKIWQKNLMITTILDNSIFLPYQGESLNN